MDTAKTTTQYGTLDVLLLYLLGYKQEVIRIHEDVLLKQSYWFRERQLRCIQIEDKTDATGQRWIVLKRLNQQTIRRHLETFLTQYNNNAVSTPYDNLTWEEWDEFLKQLELKYFRTNKPLVFSFSNQKSLLPFASDTCAFHCMANMVSASLHYSADDVMSIVYDAKNNASYIIHKASYQEGKRVMVARFGEVVYGWRTRAGVRWAFYKKHHIQFHSPLNKQKQLLDMLLEFDLEVPIEHAAQKLKLSGSSEQIKASLYDLGSKIRKKAIDVCKGSKDKVDFEISVAGDSVRMLETVS